MRHFYKSEKSVFLMQHGWADLRRLNGPFPFPLWEIKVLLTTVFLFNLILYVMICDDLFSCPIHAEMLLQKWSLDHCRSTPHPPVQGSSAVECLIKSLTLPIHTVTWDSTIKFPFYTVLHKLLNNNTSPKIYYINIWWQLCVHPAVLKNEWIICAWVLYHDVCDDMFGIADHLNV